MKRLHDPTRAPAYAALVPPIAKVAREFGYACAVHGSMSTDLDLILVAWTEEASSPGPVIAAIAALVGGAKRKSHVEPYEKPHGRLSYQLWIEQADIDAYNGIGPHLDISVIPPARIAPRRRPKESAE